MLQAGVRAPEFFLTGLSGRKHDSSELVAEGPVLVVFYKSSCPVCQMTMPFLDRIAQAGFKVIAASQDSAADTARFRDRFSLIMPVMLDREQDKYPASNLFGITNVPSLFLLEPDGGISLASSGFSKSSIEEVGKRAGVSVFRADENVPEWKAG